MSKLNKEREAFKRALQKTGSLAASLPLPSKLVEVGASEGTSGELFIEEHQSMERSTILQRPIASYIFTILSLLKEKQNIFVEIEEINENIRKNMFSGSLYFTSILDYPQIMKRIKTNPQFQLTQEGCIRFIPLLSIANKTEFLALLSRTPTGLSIRELKEGTPPKLIDSIVDELSKEELILEMPIGNSTNSDTIVYESLLVPPTTSIDPGFKRLWRNTKVPQEDSELRGQMVKLKLKVHGPTQERGAPTEFGGIEGARERMASLKRRPNRSLSSLASKKKENPYRRIKITNDYLEGIDFNDE